MKAKIFMVALAFITLTAGLIFVQSQNEPERSLSSNVTPENYESLTACEKQTILWDKIKSSAHTNLPQYSKLGLLQFLPMTMQELKIKGNLQSDFAPKDWKKYLHKRGSVAKVEIVPKGNHPYTGIFLGAECALLRLSLTYKPGGKKGVAPGLALKVLRDGIDSANISALYSIDGQGKDYNFFKNILSNIVPLSKDFGASLMHRLFKRVTSYPEELLVDHMASFDAFGEKSAKIVSPRHIFFVPNAALALSSKEHDVRNDFLKIAEGTLVYSVYALTDNKKNRQYENYSTDELPKLISESTHVADLVTSSEFIASQFGDEGIFFRHQLRP